MMPPPPPPELFAERPVRSDFAERGLPYPVRRFITLIILGVVIGGGAYIGLTRTHTSEPVEIPTIKADKNYKQRPEQPGGIDIPHQDVEVYHALEGGKSDRDQVEHLLPAPEVPQPVASSIPASSSQPGPAAIVPVPLPAATVKVENLLVPEEAPAPKIETTVQHAAVVTSPEPPTTLAPAPAPAVAVAAPKIDIATSSPQPAPVIAPPVDAPVAAAPKQQAVKTAIAGSSGVHKGQAAVQLASLPNEEDARRTMAQLQTKYASILGGERLRLVRADLGAKGIYYRIQSLPLPDQQATHVCSALKGLNAGCILVRQ